MVGFALEHGARAVVCPAVASEYDFLSLDERKTLVELVAGEVDGRVPMIGGASGRTAEEATVRGLFKLSEEKPD